MHKFTRSAVPKGKTACVNLKITARADKFKDFVYPLDCLVHFWCTEMMQFHAVTAMI